LLSAASLVATSKIVCVEGDRLPAHSCDSIGEQFIRDLCKAWEALWVDPPALQTPLPAVLPLFATGLAGLGLIGWRRKKTAAG
jgi:hypothetical protein